MVCMFLFWLYYFFQKTDIYIYILYYIYDQHYYFVTCNKLDIKMYIPIISQLYRKMVVQWVHTWDIIGITDNAVQDGPEGIDPRHRGQPNMRRYNQEE